jgi:hypothetical protein
MWNVPSKEQLATIPRLYETEDIAPEEKLIYLHCFLGECDWYMAEFDGEDTFFGYAILNGDTEMAEWGYISFRELKELKVRPGFEVDCDLFWKVKKAGQVDKIKAANGWLESKAQEEVCG